MKVPFLDLGRQHQPLRSELLDAWARVLDSCHFSLGSEVEAFERELAAHTGSPFAVGTNNGTTALHLAAVALGLGPGDEVLLPAFTFAATAWTASYVGARPRFVDIDPQTLNLDLAATEAAVGPRTRAIVLVHLFGQPAPADAFAELARRCGLFLIEDAAQAIGAHWQGRHVGTFGDLATFSFYPTKNLAACGEGGAVLCPTEERRARVRLFRVHGSPARYRHDEVGFNYRMEGLVAASLRVKLPHLSRWNDRRRAIARRYLEGLRLTDARLPAVVTGAPSVWHQFTLRHPRRDALRAHLEAAGIGTDTIYPRPLHLQPCYASLGGREGDLPVAEEASRTCLSLPIFPELTDAEVDAVITAVNGF